MTAPLILYTKPECELCEEAALLATLAGVKWRHIDISESVDLLERYRDSIPVLHDPDSNRQIAWPFDDAAIKRLAAGS